MFITIEGIVDEDGTVRFTEPIDLVPGERVLVTVVRSKVADAGPLSELSLAADWLRDEEDKAWSHLSTGGE